MAGVWDKTTPTGSDNAREGDDRIREAKNALEEALSHEDSTFPGASPSTSPIFIPGFLRNTTANRPTGDSLVSGRLFINTTLGIIERYNGSSWDSVSVNFASGTKMVFYQASAPTGWTAEAVNDKFLRVVSSGGTGGTTGGSGLAPSSTITLAHSHTVDSHTHSTPAHTHVLDWNTISSGSRDFGGSGATPADYLGGQVMTIDSLGDDTELKTTYGTGNTQSATVRGYKPQTASGGSGTSGSATPGTNSQLSNTAFQYADVVIAAKD